MIDCIVAMVILLGVLIPTGYLFTNVLSQSASARQRLTALSVAEQWIETLNNQGPPSDANNQPEVGTNISEPSSVLSGTTYAVSAQFNWTDSSGGTPDFCSSNTSPVLGLQVNVSWGHGQSITDQAILNFPASGNLTDGYLAIQVNGDPAGSPPNDVFATPWNTRVKSVPVQVSGTNLAAPYSLTPASTGCTFLALSPGTYNVQVGPGPTSAYVVNYNEASSQTQPLATQSAITIIAAAVTQVTFQYDEGAYVGIAYPSTTAIADGISCPNTAVVTCLAMGQAPTSSSSPASSPVADGIVLKTSTWSVASFPSTMTRIESVACASTACIAVGYGSSGAAAALTTNGTSWSTSSLPAGVSSQLTSIVCPPSATTPACLAVGSNTAGTAGVLLTATISGSTATWTNDTVPANTSLGQIVCPSSSAQPVCFVVGNASGGPIIISNTGSAAPGTTWTSYTQSGVTMTTISSLTCNATAFCMAIGTGKVGSNTVPVVISITSHSGTVVTWKPFTASGFTMSSFSSIACTTSGNFCWASGTGQIGSGSVGPIIVYCNTTAGSLCVSGTSAATFKNDTVPAGLSSISSLTCPSTAVPCFALDTTSSSSGVLTLASGTAWTSASLPSGIVTLTSLVCPATTACYAVGTSSSSAIVVVLKSGAWSDATFSGTTGGNPVYVSGLACTSATTCEMAAATEQAGEVFDYANASVSFSASNTPSTLNGLYIADPPIMVSDPNLQPTITIEMVAPQVGNGPQTEVGPLFPFVAGYSVAAGFCASEMTTASVSAATTPGATPSTTPAAPTVTLPMGILPIEAVSTTGVPLPNATVTIADSCSPQLTPVSSGSFPALASPPANPSNATSYTMPNSGTDGLSRIAVIYGTYQVTVKSGSTQATTTVTVNPTSIVVGASTYYMPAVVAVPD